MFVSPVSYNNDYLNGVSTIDLILISLHIMGIEPLDSPFKIIAADANKSGSITSFDIVELRKLILGIYTALPACPSWRFFSKNCQFPNPNNPFAFPDCPPVTIGSLTDEPAFIGVKIGDVNGTAHPNFTSQPNGEKPDNAVIDTLNIPDILLEPGETLEIPVSVAQPVSWFGFQFALNLDTSALSIQQILPGSGMTGNNFAVFQNRIAVSWSNTAPKVFLPNQKLFKVKLKAKKHLRLCNGLQLENGSLLPESYPALFTKPNQIALACQHLYTHTPNPGYMAPSPNPTTGGADMTVFLTEPGPARIVLINSTGRICWTTDLAAELKEIPVHIPAEAMLLQGVYTWRIESGSGQTQGKMIKL